MILIPPLTIFFSQSKRGILLLDKHTSKVLLLTEVRFCFKDMCVHVCDVYVYISHINFLNHILRYTPQTCDSLTLDSVMFKSFCTHIKIWNLWRLYLTRNSCINDSYYCITVPKSEMIRNCTVFCIKLPLAQAFKEQFSIIPVHTRLDKEKKKRI